MVVRKFFKIVGITVHHAALEGLGGSVATKIVREFMAAASNPTNEVI